MKTIAVVTVGRSDYGIYLPVLRRISAEPELRLELIAAGMHLSPEFGMTVNAIEADGFRITERVEMLLSSDSSEAIAKSMGLGTIGFAQAYGRLRPDILMVLGDRFEMHAAAVAALPFRIPVAHIHGGEITEGAIDDCLRHSITKLSHLHFVSTAEYARRLVSMGEEPWRITVSGAPALDNLNAIPLLTRRELEARTGCPFDPPPLLATFHPVTLEHEQTEYHVREFLAALDSSGMPVIFTQPNADTGGRVVARMIEEFVARHPSSRLVRNLGTNAYLSAMTMAAAMVGNSSSGIVEAPSFRLPVVNIGTRQTGRLRAANVIDTGYAREEIAAAIAKAASTAFRNSISDLVNPYGCGRAAERIVDRLKALTPGSDLIIKRFYDVPGDVSAWGNPK